MTPPEEVASLVRGSKSWRKAKILELQCMESMLADSKVYDAHSVGFMQNKVENIRLELREAQPIHRRIAGVTDALTKNRKRHIALPPSRLFLAPQLLRRWVPAGKALTGGFARRSFHQTIFDLRACC